MQCKMSEVILDFAQPMINDTSDPIRIDKFSESIGVSKEETEEVIEVL